MKNNYTSPSVELTAFTCPHCATLASFQWHSVQSPSRPIPCLGGIRATWCIECKKQIIAHYSNILFPKVSMVDIPHEDLPEDIKKDYCEAMNVLIDSPRSSCALLRLAIEKLCKELDCEGDNLNDNIAELVQRGLPPGVQESLDVIRVVGNNAVHPGFININDDPEIAVAMFKLIDLITEKMITEPRKVKSLFDSLP